MRRAIIFLLILTMPIGFLLGAHKSIDALRDDVEIRAQHVYGDPERIAGMKVGLLTTCGDHMWWDTDYTAGEPGTVETAFHFTQKPHNQYEESSFHRSDVNIYPVSGAGMSISGGEGFDLSGEGLGVLASAVAERTEPGSSRTEELVLADYVDVYPMEYQISIFRDKYYIEEYYDSLSGATHSGEPDESSYGVWMELFRFPVDPEAKMEVTVEKSLDGAVRSLEFTMADCPDLGFETVVLEEGMYFAPVFQSWEGVPIETGEFPQGYGLYYIPFKELESSDIVAQGDGYRAGSFDFDNLRMIYPMEPSDIVVAMQTDENEEVLYMLTREDGLYRYSILDLAAGELLAQVDVMEAREGELGCDYRFFPEQELLFLKHGGKAALVDISRDPRVELRLDWPEDVRTALPDSIVYRDGTLYMTALDWYDENWGFYLAVCDGEGLGYCGYYFTNLNHNNRFWGSCYVNLDYVRFAE